MVSHYDHGNYISERTLSYNLVHEDVMNVSIYYQIRAQKYGTRYQYLVFCRQTYLINCYWVYEYNKIVMGGVFPQNCINSLFVHQVKYKCYHSVQTYHQVLCTKHLIGKNVQSSIQMLKRTTLVFKN